MLMKAYQSAHRRIKGNIAQLEQTPTINYNLKANIKMINKNSSHNLTAREKNQSVVVRNSNFGDTSLDIGNSTKGTILEHTQKQLAKMKVKANEY